MQGERNVVLLSRGFGAGQPVSVISTNPLYHITPWPHGGPSAGTLDGAWGRRQQEAFAPLLDSLRSVDDQLYSAFSSHLNNLYQVLHELYEQDQTEIRQLLSALEGQRQQLTRLGAEHAAVKRQLAAARERERVRGPQGDREQQGDRAQRRDREAAATAAATKPPAGEQDGQAGAAEAAAAGASPFPVSRPSSGISERHTWRAEAGAGGGGGGGGPADSPAASPGRRPGGLGMDRDGERDGDRERDGVRERERDRSRGAGRDGGEDDDAAAKGLWGRRPRPHLVLFLPYMLHPAHQCWRFYAAWLQSWSTRRTLWLALAWAAVFLLAVGLLVGLLVPWGQLGRTEWVSAPQVVAVGPASAAVRLALSRPAAVYFAVVPEELTVLPYLPPPPPPQAHNATPPAGRRRRAVQLASWGARAGGGGGAGVRCRRAPMAAPAAAARLPRKLRPGGRQASPAAWLGGPGLKDLQHWLPAAGPHSFAPCMAQNPAGDRRGDHLQPTGQSLHQQQQEQHRRRLSKEGSPAPSPAPSPHTYPPRPPLLQLPGVGPSDLRAVVEDRGATPRLFPYAVACGVLDVEAARANYTLSINSLPNGAAETTNDTVPGSALNATAGIGSSAAAALEAALAECRTSYGMLALQGDRPVLGSGAASPGPVWPASLGPAASHRCVRCPLLRPGTRYVVLLVGDGGRASGVELLRLTTAAATNP